MRKITEQGVHFQSPVNGDKLFMSPEVSMQIQTTLNSDIVMQLDECTPYETKGHLTSEREARQSPQKQRIAAAALAFLPPVDGSIIVDAGTSTAALIALLPDEHTLTAVTHGIAAAAQLSRLEQVDLHVIGGQVRGATGAAIGDAIASAPKAPRAKVPPKA